jgi:transcriptional regulator with XRE-family HTH domain
MASMANRIRELRLAKGMTVDELAAKAELSQPYLTRLESGRRGKRGLTRATAEKLALALGISVGEVMGFSGANGEAIAALVEDAAPYDTQHDELLRDFVRKRQNVVPYKITTNVLDRIEIFAGDVVFLDLSAEAVENIEPLKPVIARIYGENSLTAVTVARQFVPPSLLITNTSGRNMPTLDIESDPVAIKGVIIAKHRSLRK